MKTFKTKTAINFPFGRGIKNNVLYYTVEKVSIDANNLIPERGYYYFIDENDNPVVVSETKGMVILRSQLSDLENNTLPALESTTDSIANLEQRIASIFLMQIDSDFANGLSFGTTSLDWEVYVPLIEEGPIV